MATNEVTQQYMYITVATAVFDFLQTRYFYETNNLVSILSYHERNLNVLSSFIPLGEGAGRTSQKSVQIEEFYFLEYLNLLTTTDSYQLRINNP